MLTLEEHRSIRSLPNRDSMGIEEAAAHAGIPRWAILQGELPTYMRAGQWRVPTAAVRAYLEWQRDGLPVDDVRGDRWDSNPRPPGPQPGATTS